MAVKTVSMYDDHDLGCSANQIKELVVHTMTNQGMITKSVAEEFLSRYAVIVVKKGWLGLTMDKVLGLKEPDDKLYQIIEINTKNNG